MFGLHSEGFFFYNGFMLNRDLIPYLRLLHGVFNTFIAVLFFYQARLGWKIRKGRKSGALALREMKRHRKLGPFLVILGISGFLVGLMLVLIDTGSLVKYPLHLFNGLLIIALISVTFGISRKIKGSDSPLRTPHFIVGVCILFLYCVQIILGLGILL